MCGKPVLGTLFADMSECTTRDPSTVILELIEPYVMVSWSEAKSLDAENSLGDAYWSRVSDEHTAEFFAHSPESEDTVSGCFAVRESSTTVCVVQGEVHVFWDCNGDMVQVADLMVDVAIQNWQRKGSEGDLEVRLRCCAPSRVRFDVESKQFLTDEQLARDKSTAGIFGMLSRPSFSEYAYEKARSRHTITEVVVYGDYMEVNHLGELITESSPKPLPGSKLTRDVIVMVRILSEEASGNDETVARLMKRITRPYSLARKMAREGSGEPSVITVESLATLRWYLAEKSLESKGSDRVNNLFWSDEIKLQVHNGNIRVDIKKDGSPELSELRKILLYDGPKYGSNVVMESAAKLTVEDEEEFERNTDELGRDEAWWKYAYSGLFHEGYLCLALKYLAEGDKLSAHIAQGAYFDVPAHVMSMIDTVYEEPRPISIAPQHFATHLDARNTIMSRKKVAGITVYPREMRETGAGLARTMNTSVGKLMKLKLKIHDDVVVARLRTPLEITKTALRNLTGVNLFAVGINMEGRGTYNLENNAVVDDLLSGNYGREGFKWIVGALLYNKVPVRADSRALHYLPWKHLNLQETGLALNEPLQSGIENLDTVAIGNSIYIDWGAELGLIELVKGKGTRLHGREAGRVRGKKLRCRVSSMYSIMG